MKKFRTHGIQVLIIGIILMVSGMVCFGANGDVNNSGSIDINDALMVARYSAGITVTGFVVGNADTNCDNSVNINDALVIARYSAGLATICAATTPTPTRTPTATPTATPTNVITKIMPLGDSITDGIGVTSGGGYRIKLWSNIKNLGKSIDFVGSLSNGPTELTDKNHEGHSGWRIDQLDTNINGWMDTYKPKIVLLHIGTNDITQNTDLPNAPNRVGGLIDKICAKLPSGGKLYVAKIIPISYASGDQAAVNFNNQVANQVQTRASAGKPVYIVDMHSALTTSDLSDQVHPNRTGYDKMADAWFSAIKNDL